MPVSHTNKQISCRSWYYSLSDPASTYSRNVGRRQPESGSCSLPGHIISRQQSLGIDSILDQEVISILRESHQKNKTVEEGWNVTRKYISTTIIPSVVCAWMLYSPRSILFHWIGQYGVQFLDTKNINKLLETGKVIEPPTSSKDYRQLPVASELCIRTARSSALTRSNLVLVHSWCHSRSRNGVECQ